MATQTSRPQQQQQQQLFLFFFLLLNITITFAFFCPVPAPAPGSTTALTSATSPSSVSLYKWTRERQRALPIASASAPGTGFATPSTSKKSSSSSSSSATAASKFREELVTLMTLPEESREGKEQSIAQRIDFVVSQLAESYVPPQTLPFMNLLLEGTWINNYNSWNVRRQLFDERKRARQGEEEEDEEDDDDFFDLLAIDDDEEEEEGEGEGEGEMSGEGVLSSSEESAPPCRVALRAFRQSLSPNLTTGGVVNTVLWECTESENGDEGLTGALIVRGRFEVNSRGILEVGEVEHDLRMAKAPRNPDALIRAVQRVVPFDVFDPNGTFVETAFIDHELRVTQTHSTRFGTITNLYVRNATALHKSIAVQQ